MDWGLLRVGPLGDSQVRRGRLALSKPTLKALGTKRLKLKFHKLLSSFAIKFNWRRYRQVTRRVGMMTQVTVSHGGFPLLRPRLLYAPAAGYHIAMVGQCRLILSNPHRKRLHLSA